MARANLFLFSFFFSTLIVSGLCQNPCSGLWLGQLVPDPDRCYGFFRCVTLVPIPGTCNANMIFDPSLKYCVPGNQDTCEFGEVWSTTTERITEIPTNSTEITSTTESSSPPPNLDAICENIFFGARPYPENISYFVGCVRGRGVIIACLSNEIFNTEINECVPTTTTTTSFPITPPPVIEGHCNGVQRGFVPYPDGDCGLYIQCINEQESNILQCPMNQIFDKTIQGCRLGNRGTCEFYEELTTMTA